MLHQELRRIGVLLAIATIIIAVLAAVFLYPTNHVTFNSQGNASIQSCAATGCRAYLVINGITTVLGADLPVNATPIYQYNESAAYNFSVDAVTHKTIPIYLPYNGSIDVYFSLANSSIGNWTYFQAYFGSTLLPPLYPYSRFIVPVVKGKYDINVSAIASRSLGAYDGNSMITGRIGYNYSGFTSSNATGMALLHATLMHYNYSFAVPHAEYVETRGGGHVFSEGEFNLLVNTQYLVKLEIGCENKGNASCKQYRSMIYQPYHKPVSSPANFSSSQFFYPGNFEIAFFNGNLSTSLPLNISIGVVVYK